MLNYDVTPAQPGSAPGAWPAGTKIQRTPGLPMLLVAAHPRCPCTRATLGELALLMVRLKGRLRATVLFVRPAGVPEGWEVTDLWRDAEQIAGVTVMSDPDGEEAARFGALASGQTMLYSAEGRLLFSGGITRARGHSGDNAGRSAIVARVMGEKPDQKTTPVFGCYLGSQKTRNETTEVNDDGPSLRSSSSSGK